MTVRPFPNRAVPKGPPRKVRDGASEALAEVERATRALHRELSDELERMLERQPEVSVWITTALWMLEIAAKDLVAEPDRERLRVGIPLTLQHAMRVSAGLEIAATMGVLDADPSRCDARIGAILTKLERARQAA